VVLFNRHATWWPVTIRVTWAQLGYGTTPGFRAVVRDLYAERDLGVYEDGFEARVSSHDVMAIRVTPLGQVTPGGDNPSEKSEVVTVGSEWRPWSHAPAAQLQARMREAARQARRRAAIVSRLVSFLLAHRYSLGLSAAVLLGAIVVAVARWVVGRTRRRARRYQAVPASEMSFGSKGFGSRSAASSPIMWEALPSSTSASSDSDGSSSSDEGAV
jgi:hypothetical protein